MLQQSLTLRGALLVKAAALILAAALWWPNAHRLFAPDLAEFRTAPGVAPKARKLAGQHLAIWRDEALRARELAKMQQRNPEWDFMSRTYFVLALANMARRDPAYVEQACAITDEIIANTLQIEAAKGQEHFLLGYARTSGPWTVRPGRSLFVDGEIALMLAARRFVAEKPEYRPLLAERVRLMVERMRASPVLSAESYPDECWLFCNTVALAAIRMADALDGSDHSAFLQEWVRTARAKLLHSDTGLLIAAYTVEGDPAASGPGPEGSSIWMACHMLQIVDPVFARDQFDRSRLFLGNQILGFGFSREWPASCPEAADIDSGPVVPILGASASASGLAIIGAAAFDDRAYLARLLTSLEFIGFPEETADALRYRASNPVGDAVLLYGLVLGPLWEDVLQRKNHDER